MVPTDKIEVDQTDVALLVEELVKIYTIPTPKGWSNGDQRPRP